jgi:two-component system, LytTR family, response regulator
MLRVLIADDERPARAFLANMLRRSSDVDLVAEAASGAEAIEAIERARPDLALLDLQMPEVDGLAVVRMVRRDALPLVAFVTAHDDYAVQAFELNVIDYLLKPVEPARLEQTLARARERLPFVGEPLKRIPVRRRDDTILLNVDGIASIVADGELLHLTTASGERHTITYRLKDLETRLDPVRFIRLSRSAIVNLDAVHRVSPMPGGTYVVTLTNRQQIAVSRSRARVLRDTLLKL